MLTNTAKATVASLLLAATVATPNAIAMERPNAGVTEMLGIYILSQGNEALLQIREDMRKDLMAHLKPYLPKPDSVVPTPAPAQAEPTTK